VPVAPYWLALPLCPFPGLWGLPGSAVPRPDRRPGRAASHRLGPPSEPERRRAVRPKADALPWGFSPFQRMRPREPTHPGLPHPVLRGTTQARPRLTLPQALSAGADSAPRDSLRSVPLPGSTVRLAAVLACLPSARRPRGTRPPTRAHRLPGFPPPGSPLSPSGRRGRRRAPDAPLGFGFLLRGLPPPRDKPPSPKARDFSSRGLPAPHPKASYPVLQSFDRRGEWSRATRDTPFEVSAPDRPPQSGGADAGLGSVSTLAGAILSDDRKCVK
jgi:hypothetical protein